jgi:hypothetical protein
MRFFTLSFFMNQFPLTPKYPIGTISPFQIFTNIHRDISNFVLIASVVGTHNKLFTGVNEVKGSFCGVGSKAQCLCVFLI